MNYITAISRGFPTVQCHCSTDPTVYENIVWDAGTPIPSKETLDQWIEANPTNSVASITKYEFRKLFTLEERIAIDNVQSNPNVSVSDKAKLLTLAKDMELSAVVDLSNSDCVLGANLIELIGLIQPGRAARILSNLPPV